MVKNSYGPLKLKPKKKKKSHLNQKKNSKLIKMAI